jgi:hypothetical protein
MKPAMREFLIPQIIQSDHDDSPYGGFGDDDPVDTPGSIGLGRREKLLRHSPGMARQQEKYKQ